MKPPDGELVTRERAERLLDAIQRDAPGAPPVPGIRRFVRDLVSVVPAFDDLDENAQAVVIKALVTVSDTLSMATIRDAHRDLKDEYALTTQLASYIEEWSPRVRALIPLATLSFQDAEVERVRRELYDMRTELTVLREELDANTVASREAIMLMSAEARVVADAVMAEARQSLQETAAQLLADVSAGGAQIVARAKQTARNISLEAAQQQFRSEAKTLRVQIGTWGIIAAIALAAFFWFGIWLMHTQNLPHQWTWQVLYYLTIRLAVLSAIGAVATYAVRMLTAHIDLRHANSHRARIANSMAAFVEAARTETQQDAVLLKLVECITARDSTGRQTDITIGQIELLHKLLKESTNKQ